MVVRRMRQKLVQCDNVPRNLKQKIQLLEIIHSLSHMEFSTHLMHGISKEGLEAAALANRLCLQSLKNGRKSRITLTLG